MTLQARASRAAQLWVAILVCVLVLLFIETRNTPTKTLNFCINTGSDDVGAEVFVDNQKAGAVSSSTVDGPGGGVFLGYLPRGKHHVEVRKEGCKPYNTDIDMQQEHYLGVDLEPANN